MSEDERYEGWSNRETWAVALHINNDQGWQESVLDALRALVEEIPANSGESDNPYWEGRAGEIIRENVEGWLDYDSYTDNDIPFPRFVAHAARDIGSLWRVNWDELGASFLEDLES